MEPGDKNFQVFKAWVDKKNAESFQHTGTLLEQLQAVDKDKEVHVMMKTTEFFTNTNSKYRDQEYNPDASFTVEEKLPDGTEIHSYDFFTRSQGNTKAPASVGIVGPAGSGKTTALRRYIRDHPNDFHFVLCGSYNRFQSWTRSKCYNFLFPDRSRSDGIHLRDYFAWMRKNPQLITFHIDAIDTLPFASGLSDDISLSDDTLDADRLYEPQEIVSSIMAGKLFEGCKFLCSSREHGFMNLSEGLRPDRMVSLVGLSNDSINLCSKSSLGESKGKTFCDRIENEIPGLWVALASPFFLCVALIGYKKNPEELMTTRCGVLIQLLKNLIRSDPHQEIQVLSKLKLLAYDGIVDNKVTFNATNLEKSGLTAEEATIFPTLVSWSVRPRSLSELSRNLIFNHQCFQELFCALRVVEMPIDGLKKFLSEILKTSIRLSVVRHFIVGILMNEKTCDIARENGLLNEPDESILEEKKKLLSDFLKEALGNPNRSKKSVFLDLILTLSDGGSHVRKSIEEAMGSIDVSSQPCKPMVMYAIGSVLKYCKSLYEFDLSDCGLDGNKMQAFYHGLSADAESRMIPQIDKLRMKSNHDLGTQGVKYLGESLQFLKPKKITLDSSRISANQFQKFREVLEEKKIQITKLHMKEPNGCGVVASDEMVKEICLLLRHCVRSINIFGWRLTVTQKNLIQDALDNIPEASRSLLKVTVGDQYTSKEFLVPGSFDAYVEELLRDSFQMREMRKFARSVNGLSLSVSDAEDIKSNHARDAYEERRAYFEKWRANNGYRSTAVRDLKKIIDKYHNQTSQEDEYKCE